MLQHFETLVEELEDADDGEVLLNIPLGYGQCCLRPKLVALWLMSTIK